MRIFVVGNINVGKSFFINKLQCVFPDYPLISIDQYRQKYSNGSLQAEHQTRDVFAKDIIESENAIIEYSGGDSITSLFIDDIPSNSFIVLEISEKVDICLARLKNKDFSKVPYPTFDESISDTIIRLDKEYKSGCVDKNFKKKYLKKYDINSSNEVEMIPFFQFDLAIKIANYYRKKDVQLIAYGSLGRGDMTLESDIDLFLITNKAVPEVCDELRNTFIEGTEWIIQKNQIDIFTNNQLIEITVIKSIDELKCFYFSSEIKDYSKTVLVGNSNVLNELKFIIENTKYDFISELEYTISRLRYYCKSLERIARKKDEYKYFFHNNIVIHEYIRITYFIQGKRDFSYLPKKVFDFTNRDIIERMTYHFGDRFENHFSIIYKEVNKIISSANSYLNDLKEIERSK